MSIKYSIFVFLLIKLNFLTAGHAERTKDQMYEHLNGRYSCFRRLDATHQVGCSSKQDGSTGIVHFIEKQSDLDFILKKGSAGNYMPVMPTALLEPHIVSILKDSEIITGVVLYTKEIPDNFTHEHTCPNPHSNTEKTCDISWNKYGTGLLYEDIPFPIYFVNTDQDLAKIKDCFSKFNNFSYETQYMRSLCSLELDAFMYATTNTPTCMRRSNSKMNMNPVKFCDPLGGENVWGSLFSLDNSTKNIILASRLDTTSLFHGMYPGAANPITGLVTFLATADLLKRMVAEEDGNEREKNVLFMLFNGESYDYIGSQRMVYDMEKGEFPIKSSSDAKNPVPTIGLDDIHLFVELGQLMKSNYLYAHMTLDDQAGRFYETFKRNYKPIKQLRQEIKLPPASFQTFLRAKPKMSGIILSDYNDQYLNKFYNSIYDNASNIEYQYYNLTEGDSVNIDEHSIQWHTAKISQALALTLYDEIMKKKGYNGTKKPRLELIDELYNCYLLDPDCKIHQAVQKKKLRETPHNSYSFYVGVNIVPNLLTYAIGLTLGWLTGDVTTNRSCTNDPQNPMYQYFEFSKSMDNINSTQCYRVILNFTEAVSPAFIIEDYDWKSGQYSSWSESTWRDLTVRMYLKPSAAHERFTIALGSITLIMSLILIYFVKSRSHILFVTPENCSPTSC